MAEAPRGPGRVGGVGRGRGRGGPNPKQHENMSDVPWRILLGKRKLEELQDKDGNSILLTFDKYKDAFKKALNECRDRVTVVLLLRCLAKCCECESLRQPLIDMFTILDASSFLREYIPEFVLNMVSMTTPRKQLECKESLRDIFNILIKFKNTMPKSVVILRGIMSVIETPINVIKSVGTGIIDDDMWETYEEIMDRKETAKPKRRQQHTFDDEEDDNEAEPNDHFRDYPVFPTTEEVQLSKAVNLRRNKTFGGYENLDHYLDVQYRLLREDFIAPLREGIKEYMDAVHSRTPDKKLHELRIYRDVQIISPICNFHGLCRRISFYYPGMNKIRWESSKHLIFGSLLCLSSDNFQTLWFATVTNRDLKIIRKGLIDIKFAKDYEDISTIPPDTVFVMAETTAYFEAYRHVLTGLQNMHNGDLPFENHIVKCLSDVKPPSYLERNPDFIFDLRPLVDEDIILYDRKNGDDDNANYNFSPKSDDARQIKVTDPTTWPAPELLHLDNSQLRAIQIALSKEFVITQGPPGTGKTYIGLKIVKALLHNKEIWSKDHNTGEEDNRPLLVVCYTNHALDQFLEGIVQFYKGDVLRLGSRSSSEIMKPLSINNKRMTMRTNREVPIEIHSSKMEIKHSINSLQEEVNMIADRMEKAKREILHEDALKNVMGECYDRLISGYERIMRDMYGYDFQWEKPKKCSALLEWLGYGEFLGFENMFEEQTTQEQKQAGNRDIVHEADERGQDENDQNRDAVHKVDEQRQDEDGQNEQNRGENDGRTNNFINVLDERDVEITQRQKAVENEDDEDETLGDHLIKILQENFPLVALDVSELDLQRYRQEDLGFRPQKPKQKNKQLKKKIRKLLSSTDRMSEDEIELIDMWDILPGERWRMYRYWQNVYCENLQDKICDKEIEFEQTCGKYHEVLMQEDKAIMRNSTVIGLTTTCAARYQSVLQEIGPRIIIVEEAAEVLEGHVITTLSRRCEHLILIGDHKQLKPKPTVYKLARDYKLDLSLFERMANNDVDLQCLALQHRMSPKISKMMRIIYPELKDHDVVKGYDRVRGVSEDVFFIDHMEYESPEKDLRSHSNKHEAEYLVELCRYLLLQGYSPSQITVLTTYSGQLYELKYRMPKSEFEGVRVTVVDNYQGEENDIILLSLVRSNDDGTIGFLREDNRVCVAMSRAKKGLYVIGNFTMLSDRSTLWRQFVDHARKHRFIGKALRLYCENHQDDVNAIVNAENPSDFQRSPGGGCRKPCEQRLSCGHTCPSVCHVRDPEHKEIQCRRPCTKTCSRGHKCKKRCNQACDTCQELVPKRMPKCGHTQNVPCYLDPIDFQCKERCNKSLPCDHTCQKLCGESHTEECIVLIDRLGQCGHSTKIKCHQQKSTECPEPCPATLECGHKCKGTCGECQNGRLHKQCDEACGRILVCEHECQEKCANCPPCKEKCRNRCKHNYCGKQCGDECNPCAEDCEWQCEHYQCDLLCSTPCDRPRCNEPCKKLIPKCQHPCIGLCGEPCPKLCRLCDAESVAEILFGSEDDAHARFVELEDCKHVIEVTSLDKWMDDIKTEQIKLKECPKCKMPIRRNLRYGNIIKQTLNDIELVKQRILGSKAEIQKLEKGIRGGLFELESKDARKVKQFHIELTKGAIDENTLKTINTQINILVRINNLKKKFETNEGRSGRYNEMYEKALSNVNVMHQRTLTCRQYFTEQEINDIQTELDRLILLYKFMRFKERKTISETSVSRDLSLDVMVTEQHLTDGRRLSAQRRLHVDKTLAALKDVIPLTTLGISDDERVQIITAMGLSPGHWFKCIKGHIYAIGDCGGAEEESKCPECKAGIGGTNHRVREDNALATEMDGASHAAWSTQTDLDNYDPFEVRFH